MSAMSTIEVNVENFEKEVQRLASRFIDSDTCYNLSFDAEDKFNSFLGLLKAHGMDYTTRSSTGKRCTEKGRLRWKMPDIPYFKIPFSVSNIIWKECVVGPKYYKTRKDKSCVNDHPQERKGRFRLQPTKKVGCPATMRIIELKCYPQHTVTVSKNICKIQAKMLGDLKNKLQRNEHVLVENRFYVTVSKPSSHSHISWTCFLNEELDETLKKQIEKYVSEGVTDIRTIRVLLKRQVKARVSDKVPLASRSFAVNDDSISNGGTSSMEDISPPRILTSSKNSTSKILSDVCEIRQLSKDVYDSVFLISPESLDDSSASVLVKMLVDTRNFVDNFIATESNDGGGGIVVLPKSSHSLSDVPIQRKRVKKMKTK